MKQKDIATLIAVGLFSAIFSWIISSKVIVTSSNRQQSADVAESLSTEFALPDKKFFNSDSINATTNSGLEATNKNPFNGSSR